jgi:flagellar hook assembly protein FlgD
MPANTRWYVDESVAPGARYEYVLVAHGVTGSTFVSQRAGVTVPSAALALRQNAPNPFAEATTIGITLPERAEIDVAVFDVAGRRVATIAAGTRDGGEHELSWNGTDDAGRRVGAGVYFYRLEAGNQTLTRKLLIVR